MAQKTALERMNTYNNKCTILGVKEFEFKYDEIKEEVQLTKIYMPEDESEWVVNIPEFVSCVKTYVWSDLIWNENRFLSNGRRKCCHLYIPKGCRITDEFNELFEQEDFVICVKEIVVDKDHELYSSENGVLFNKDKTVLLAYPYAKEDESYTVPDSVIQIEEGAFYKNDYLKKLYLSSNILDIKECKFGCWVEIAVDANNTSYTSIDGSLYSKNGKILYHLFAFGSGKIKIAEGTIIIKNNESLVGDFDELYLPDSVKPLEGLYNLVTNFLNGDGVLVAPKSLKEYIEGCEIIVSNEIIYY